MTVELSGTYNGFNPAVLAGGSTQVLLEDAPVEAIRHIETESVDGDTAIVRRTDEISIDGAEPSVTEVRFAVDRETVEGGPAPDGADDVTSSEGLVFGLPVDPSSAEGTYDYWDQSTLQSAPLTFEGEDTLGGRDVYRYQSVSEGELADPSLLGLPATLPKAQLAALAPGLAGVLPADLLAALPSVLPSLPEEIPVTWTSRATALVDADRELGIPIAGGNTQEITGALDFGVTVVEVPFATIQIYSTDDDIQKQGDDVGSNASLLDLLGTVLPIVAAVLGVLLLLTALLLARRAARRGIDAPPPAERSIVATPA